MLYSRGQIVLVLFPNSDLRTAKRRPVLVIQADELNTGLSQTIVAMISSNTKRAEHPSRVLVKISTTIGQQTGLLSDSVIMTDNLATILDTEIDRSIGVFTNMSSVEVALRHTLGI